MKLKMLPALTAFTKPAKARIISNLVKQMELELAVSVNVCCHNSLSMLVYTYNTHVLGKLHRLATCEERGTQDRGSQVQQAGQQGAVRPMEEPNT